MYLINLLKYVKNRKFKIKKKIYVIVIRKCKKVITAAYPSSLVVSPCVKMQLNMFNTYLFLLVLHHLFVLVVIYF